MTLSDIKFALKIGRKVFWKNDNYKVIKDSVGQYLIISQCNGYCVGLTDAKGQLIDQPETFYYD